MILTITMNPSLDFTYIMGSFKLGKLNRVESPTRNVGGKGINAGRTAALSGSQVVLTGFLGGKIGRLTKEYLKEENLFDINMIEIGEETRTSITIMNNDNIHTELVEKGPSISEEKIQELFEHIGTIHLDKKLDIICICGSVNTKNKHLLCDIVEHIRKNLGLNTPVLVDVSGEQFNNLVNLNGHKPNFLDFIKPNEHELAEFTGKEIKTKADALAAIKNERFSQIPYIIASLGENGAVCKVFNNYYYVNIPRIKIKSTTGSGDAVVGGFAHAITTGKTPIDSVKYAIACGMSNAQHSETGTISKQDIPELTNLIQIEYK